MINQIEDGSSFQTAHFQHKEDECGYLSLSFYTKDSSLKKIFYTYEEGCAQDAGMTLVQYFDDDGMPLKVAFHIFSEQNPRYCYAGRGNANFLSRDIERSCAEIDQASGTVVFSKKFLSPCDENIENIKQLFISDHYCFFKDAQSALKLKDYEIKNKKYKVKSMDYSEKGAFVNSTVVNMRKEPSQKSESQGHLYPLETVKILEKGSEDTIEGIGKNRWYKIQVKSYAYIFQGSVYRENTEGWVFGTFLHNYQE